MENGFYVIMWNSSFSKADGSWDRMFYALGSRSKFKTIDDAYQAILSRHEHWSKTVTRVAIVGCEDFRGRILHVGVTQLRNRDNEPELSLSNPRG